jgi:hypothetical protein
MQSFNEFMIVRKPVPYLCILCVKCYLMHAQKLSKRCLCTLTPEIEMTDIDLAPTKITVCCSEFDVLLFSRILTLRIAQDAS